MSGLNIEMAGIPEISEKVYIPTNVEEEKAQVLLKFLERNFGNIDEPSGYLGEVISPFIDNLSKDADGRLDEKSKKYFRRVWFEWEAERCKNHVEATNFNIDKTFSKEWMTKKIEKPEWLIDGLIGKGLTTILIGKPFCGKSTLAHNMCVAIANGWHTFLERNVYQGSTYYFGLDSSEYHAREHFKQLDLTVDSPFGYWPRKRALPSETERALWLEQLIKEYKFDVVFIDTLARFIHIKDGNDYNEAVQKLDPYVKMAEAYKCALVFLHHARKNMEGDAVDSALGSTGLTSEPDVAIVMSGQDDSQRKIRSLNNEGERLDPHYLDYDRDKGYISLGLSIGEDKRKTWEESIIEFLRWKQTGATWEDLCKGAHPDSESGQTTTRDTLKPHILKLIDQKTIVKTGLGRKGNPEKFFYNELPEARKGESSIKDTTIEDEELVRSMGFTRH